MSKVDHPQHYNRGNIEAIDVIEDWNLNFNLGNVIKYISRAGAKENEIEDIEKALWYLQRHLDNLKEQDEEDEDEDDDSNGELVGYLLVVFDKYNAIFKTLKDAIDYVDGNLENSVIYKIIWETNSNVFTKVGKYDKVTQDFDYF